ncbi:hypothetical protein PV11_10056 [Exophiala sideris]|uniref:Uncharacterized protein n=1 Tax=Exophiala sideris TaxID=1016849 RepID=A0A0D1VQH4_9EURO|nr:hypothetical protein PV11_10056 [Exophiala sideris]
MEAPRAPTVEVRLVSRHLPDDMNRFQYHEIEWSLVQANELASTLPAGSGIGKHDFIFVSYDFATAYGVAKLVARHNIQVSTSMPTTDARLDGPYMDNKRVSSDTRSEFGQQERLLYIYPLSVDLLG